MRARARLQTVFGMSVGSATIQAAARSMNTGTHTRRGGQQGRSTISRVSRDTVGSFFATAPISLDSLDPMMIFPFCRRDYRTLEISPSPSCLLNTEKARMRPLDSGPRKHSAVRSWLPRCWYWPPNATCGPGQCRGAGLRTSLFY
jgi:hypothetical protein